MFSTGMGSSEDEEVLKVGRLESIGGEGGQNEWRRIIKVETYLSSELGGIELEAWHVSLLRVNLKGEKCGTKVAFFYLFETVLKAGTKGVNNLIN